MYPDAFLSSLRGGLAACVRPSRSIDPRERPQHEAFLAMQIGWGLAALVFYPPYLAATGRLDAAAAAIFLFATGPLLSALYVARTGRLALGRVASDASLAALVVTVAAATGGLASPVLALLALIPLQSVTARRTRPVLGAGAVAALGLATAAGLAGAGLLEEASRPGVTIAALSAAIAAATCMTVAAGLMLRQRVRPGIDRQAEELQLLRSLPDLAARFRRNGNVVAAQGAPLDKIARSEEELLGEGLVRLVHVQDRPLYLQTLDTAWATGEARAELRIALREGGHANFELRARRIGGGHKDADVAGVLRDAAPRAVAEAALRTALETAERDSIGKGRLIANLSHELRTPLNAILGFSEMLATGQVESGDGSRQREYARLIHDSGSHLLAVVNAILDMSKLETGSFQVLPEQFDLDQAIRGCRQLMEPQATAAGLRLETCGLGEAADVVADPRAVRQILLNLLSNAIKASRAGGQVVVGAERTAAGAVAIYVADEGAGIPDEEIGRLGQPFVQLQDGYARGGGTGLGLSVVRGLARLHGGDMRIESELGLGTRVTVTLPQPGQGDNVVVVGKMARVAEAKEAGGADARRSA